MPPINKGTNASKVLASQPHHPLQSVGGAVGIVYELPKKRGVFPKHPRVRRIAPSPKKHPNDDVRFSDRTSPSRQNNGCGQQLKKKTWLPRRYGYKRLPVLSGADRYDSSAATRGMTETGHNTTAMEFALLALFTCSLASVIATVFRGTY